MLCPEEGVMCSEQAAVWVLPGYYRPPDPPSSGNVTEELASPTRCPMGKEACLGDVTPGNASCAAGHTGPLCGVAS